jgi:PKHD-type hydroxylase
MDTDVTMYNEPPVRKISMTCLLSPEDQFEGGDLELMAPGKKAKLKQGHAIIFASFLNHRVAPVTKGVRQSLVVWFGGEPFK